MTKPSVLVVDDQESWREAAYELLRGEFDIELAGGYDEAIHKLETQSPPFHVVVADIRLIHGDPQNTQGLDVIARAQELGGYTNAIVWTAFSAAETMKRAFRELMVFDYIAKDPRSVGGKRMRFDVGGFVTTVRGAAEAAIGKQEGTKILVVEEDPLWKRRLSETLEADGYTVKCASDYGEALNLAAEGDYGLLTVEIARQDQPIRHGLEFIEHIKAASPHTQIIIISDAGARNTMRIAFAKLGVVDFLPKTVDGGFDPKEFSQSVRQVYRLTRDLFVVADFRNLLPDQVLPTGHECVLTLSGRRWVSRPDKAVMIWLPPYKDSVRVEAVVYVENGGDEVEITPTPSQVWTLPTKGDVPPLIFGLKPQHPGDYVIQIELFGESGWWRRLDRNLYVRNNGDGIH